MTQGQTIKTLAQRRAASQESEPREPEGGKNLNTDAVESSSFDDGLVNVSCQLLCQRSENAGAAHCRFTRESGGVREGGGGVGLGERGGEEAMAEHRGGEPGGTLDSVAIHVHSRLA